MREAERLAKCNRLGGCDLEFKKEPPTSPVRLDQLAGRPNVRVKLYCSTMGCKQMQLWKAEELMKGLERRHSSPLADAFSLTERMKSLCPLCKRLGWRIEVLWVDTNSLNWNRLGEGVFTKEGRG